MGYIEIHDGSANRQIRVPAVPGTIRVDVHDGDRPCVIVPETVRLVRDTAGSPPETSGDRAAPITPKERPRGGG